jgi:hypothetical protein
MIVNTRSSRWAVASVTRAVFGFFCGNLGQSNLLRAIAAGALSVIQTIAIACHSCLAKDIGRVKEALLKKIEADASKIEAESEAIRMDAKSRQILARAQASLIRAMSKHP